MAKYVNVDNFCDELNAFCDALGFDWYVRKYDLVRVMEKHAVEAEPVRHGHWIEHTSWYWTQECECSECGNIEYGFNYPYETEKAVDHAGLYCRRCGAKMDEVTE